MGGVQKKETERALCGWPWFWESGGREVQYPFSVFFSFAMKSLLLCSSILTSFVKLVFAVI